jgi:hypothetical protein
MYKNSVRTLQETHYVSPQGSTSSFRLGKYSRTVWNTQIHSVGRMQRYSMLKRMVRIEPLGFKGLKIYLDLYHKILQSPHFTSFGSRDIAHMVSRRHPITAGRLRSQVWPCRMCGEQSIIGAGFLQILVCLFPLLIRIHRSPYHRW